MDFALSAQQDSIRDAILKICSQFDDAYWLTKDRDGGFPHEFYEAMAKAGWLGICIPERRRRSSRPEQGPDRRRPCAKPG